MFTTVRTLWQIQNERQTDGLTTQLTTLNKVFLEKVCSCWSRSSLVMVVGSLVLRMTACLWMLSWANCFQPTRKQTILSNKWVVQSKVCVVVLCRATSWTVWHSNPGRGMWFFSLLLNRHATGARPTTYSKVTGPFLPRVNELDCDDYSFLFNAGV